MKQEIVVWVRNACRKYNLRGEYLTEKDIYRLTKNGNAVMAFHTDNFYQIPPRMRLNHIEPMIKGGLTLNLGEKQHQDSYMKRHGKRIC